MNTFQLILLKIANKQLKYFNPHDKFFFFRNKALYLYNKQHFDFFRFIDEKEKKKINDIHVSAQKKYHSFIKLAMIFRKKKNSTNNCNLSLCQFTKEKNQKNIKLYSERDKKIYMFSYSELLKIWNTSLTKHDELINMMALPKNPYTNIEFTKSELFYIYNKFIDYGILIPNIITCNYKCFFNIHKTYLIFNTTLRQIHIRDLINTYSNNTIFTLILQICRNFPISTKNIPIFSEYIFENNNYEELLSKFKPILYHYLSSEYSLNEMIKNNSRKFFRQTLKKINHHYKKINHL